MMRQKDAFVVACIPEPLAASRPGGRGASLPRGPHPPHTRDGGFRELPSRAAPCLGVSRPGGKLALGSAAPPASQQASLSPGVLNRGWGAVGTGLLHKADGITALLSGRVDTCPAPHSAADPTGCSQDPAPATGSQRVMLAPWFTTSWGLQHPFPQHAPEARLWPHTPTLF